MTFSIQAFQMPPPLTSTKIPINIHNHHIPLSNNLNIINKSIRHIQSKKQCSMLYVSSNSNENANPLNENNHENNRALGVLVLLTVPFAWGTYAPVVKYVYEMDPPVPGFVFSGGYYLIAALTLSILAFLQNKFRSDVSGQGSDVGGMVLTNNDEKLSLKVVQESEKDFEHISNSNQQSLQLLAGIELGSYLFIGNCLQVVGLKTVPADRAAFLVQLTTIMVPLFSAAFAGDLSAIPIVTWLACILAFIGVIVMGLDDTAGAGLESFMSQVGNISFSGGDLLIVTAAVAYTMHVIRLGRYAKFTTPLGLAASKASIEAIFSIALVSFLISMGQSDISFLSEMSAEITTYFQTLKDKIALGEFPPNDSGKVIGAVLWTGWVTCAYTIYAQSFGQRRVSPTDANLIYSMQPLFSALFAFILLGESLGKAGFVGASFIASALWIVTTSKDEQTIVTIDRNEIINQDKDLI